MLFNETGGLSDLTKGMCRDSVEFFVHYCWRNKYPPTRANLNHFNNLPYYSPSAGLEDLVDDMSRSDLLTYLNYTWAAKHAVSRSGLKRFKRIRAVYKEMLTTKDRGDQPYPSISEKESGNAD